jgi:hypothetical protein
MNTALTKAHFISGNPIGIQEIGNKKNGRAAEGNDATVMETEPENSGVLNIGMFGKFVSVNVCPQKTIGIIGRENVGDPLLKDGVRCTYKKCPTIV